jgi:hypothetical protein
MDGVFNAVREAVILPSYDLIVSPHVRRRCATSQRAEPHSLSSVVLDTLRIGHGLECEPVGYRCLLRPAQSARRAQEKPRRACSHGGWVRALRGPLAEDRPAGGQDLGTFGDVPCLDSGAYPRRYVGVRVRRPARAASGREASSEGD